MAAAGRSGWHRRQAQVAVRERLEGVTRVVWTRNGEFQGGGAYSRTF